MSELWPKPDAPGTFNIHCSCGHWKVTGSAKEILDAARQHDDSPQRNHIVMLLRPYANESEAVS
jgi:hypothetical protein